MVFSIIFVENPLISVSKQGNLVGGTKPNSRGQGRCRPRLLLVAERH